MIQFKEVSTYISSPPKDIDGYINELVASIGSQNFSVLTAQEQKSKIKNLLIDGSIQSVGAVILTIAAAADLTYLRLNPDFQNNRVLNGILLGADGVSLLASAMFIYEALKDFKEAGDLQVAQKESKYFQLHQSDEV